MEGSIINVPAFESVPLLSLGTISAGNELTCYNDGSYVAAAYSASGMLVGARRWGLLVSRIFNS